MDPSQVLSFELLLARKRKKSRAALNLLCQAISRKWIRLSSIWSSESDRLKESVPWTSSHSEEKAREKVQARLLLQLLRTAPVCREGEALPWKPFIILARTPLSVAGVVSFQYLSLSAIPCVSVFCHTLIHSSILRSLAAESLSRPTYRLLPFAFKPVAGRSSVLLFPMSSCWLGGEEWRTKISDSDLDSSGQCFHRSRQSEGSEAKVRPWFDLFLPLSEAIDHFYDPFLFASLAALLRPEVWFIDPSQFFHSSNTDERFQHRIWGSPTTLKSYNAGARRN